MAVNPGRHPFCLQSLVEVTKEKDEFVSAKTRQGVAGAKAALEPFAHRPEQSVAGAMGRAKLGPK